ncbi:adenylate/guanylate cyclase domain-containing protein [Chitinophaga cymbidii]|uniref:Guanylate cyclase domain-containing protein n=1 Tax=Chitinophaga cymbidii TaxID=1096750 RepID=A0A512RRV6_9BACT|nr:adenylate/guanylate cyclase domain-containing protein [Chitinophaga cymbidii]GEP98430.1 hypothetical protein CCY01nite_46900 [Chitinophaga cymbidii]
MNRRTVYKFRQLFIITAAWLVIGFLIAVYEHFVLFTNNSAGPAPGYSFLTSVLMNMGAGFIGAMVGGSALVFYVNVRYRDKSYGHTVIFVTLFFLFVVLLVNIVMRIFIEKPDSYRVLKNGLVWGIVVAVTQLFLQINSKFGQGVFWNFLRGKYNTPKEESRIFMFLDLNSSTTIAERLGDKKYHAFLKDLFSDITNPILDNKGEIYQYVGDEVIIAWKYENGIDNLKCIQCFFDIKEHLQRLNDKYLRQYDLTPAFKAGIHCGKVVAGEVGIIKRDITYSGDVLNTTSRIQGMCREFNAEVIVSADLAAELQLTGRYAVQALGAIRLKGKEKEMQLIALSR